MVFNFLIMIFDYSFIMLFLCLEKKNRKGLYRLENWIFNYDESKRVVKK